ncbi:MAG: peptide deformylase [Phycisphaerales bacterium]|jgi:peptide deformylase|nr:peptide deformylase [Phycisphaerales bacterium]
MAVDAENLSLVVHPAEVLRRRALPVDPHDEEVRRVARKMIEVMRAEGGIGLAAPQVGLPWRLFVLDVPPEEGEPLVGASGARLVSDGAMVFLNPELSDPAPGVVAMEEGCLSLPDIRGDVLRPAEITARAIGLDGTLFELRAGGLLARCIQHENDHLDGVLIIDKMTMLSRMRVRSAVRALERNAAR